MIPVYRIPLIDAMDYQKIPPDYMRRYVKGREDIIEKTDIFFENSRSRSQTLKDFGLFKEVGSPEGIVLFPVYLELYEWAGLDVINVIEEFSKRYHPNLVIFQWNHDVDFAVKHKRAGNINNARIINFNTSSPNANDILVPFWAINTVLIDNPKKYLAGFIGSLNYQTRYSLVSTIRNKPRYFVASGMPKETYLNAVSECTHSLCPRGQGLSSYRFYECMHLTTVPVLMADTSVLPYPDLDYSEICLRLPESAANDFNTLDGMLRMENPEKFLENIKKVRDRFTLSGVQREIHNRLQNGSGMISKDEPHGLLL